MRHSSSSKWLGTVLIVLHCCMMIWHAVSVLQGPLLLLLVLMSFLQQAAGSTGLLDRSLRVRSCRMSTLSLMNTMHALQSWTASKVLHSFSMWLLDSARTFCLLSQLFGFWAFWACLTTPDVGVLCSAALLHVCLSNNTCCRLGALACCRLESFPAPSHTGAC